MLNPDRTESFPPTPQAIQTAIDITEGINALPAVAVADWCDRAAACMTRLVRRGVALVVIGLVDEGGRMVGQEAAGVAAGHHGPERARGPGRSQPKLMRDELVADSLLDGLRARAQKMVQIGWIPEGLGHASVGALNGMPAGRNWRTGSPGRLWAELAPAELLVGMAPLGGVDYGRVLLVELAPTPPAGPEVEDVAVLRAVLPALARRAVLAVGAVRGSPGQWLTVREQSVLDRLVIGRSVKQIAEELERSDHTIHGHVKSLHRKLHASNRGELIARALGYPMPEPAVRITRACGGAASQVEAAPASRTGPISFPLTRSV